MQDQRRARRASGKLGRWAGAKAGPSSPRRKMQTDPLAWGLVGVYSMLS